VLDSWSKQSQHTSDFLVVGQNRLGEPTLSGEIKIRDVSIAVA